MTEGWFIRGDTGVSFQIHEHELDIRDPALARRLGVPDDVSIQFGRYVPGRDRCKFLRWLLGQVPIIRARGHGVYATLEWASCGNQAAFTAIHHWGDDVGAGPCLLLNMANIKTGQRFRVLWQSFDEAMRADKPFPRS